MLILGAFAGARAGWFHQKSPAYLLPNLVGSAELAGAAIPGHQWGFLLLEGARALTSLAALAHGVTRTLTDFESYVLTLNLYQYTSLLVGNCAGVSEGGCAWDARVLDAIIRCLPEMAAPAS